jgi:hypothetical protein
MPDGTFVSIDRLRGKIRVSPSQLATARACRRKWGFTRALGGRGNKYAARGSEVHDILDKWGRGSAAINPLTHYGAIAATAVDHIPAPGFMEVETAFEVETEYVIFTGRRDLVFFDTRVTGGLWVIGDYKTTTSFKWALTPDDLPKDEQGVIYGLSIFETEACDFVELRWIYLLDPGENATPGRYKSHVVRTVVSRDQIYKAVETMIALALELEAYDGLEPNELPHNVNTCDAYGGCPYMSECGLTAGERMRATMAQSELQKQIQAEMAKRGGGGPGPELRTSTGTPAPAAKPSTGDGLTPAQRIAAIRAKSAAGAAPREEALEEVARERAAQIVEESTVISDADAAEIKRIAAGSEKPRKTRTKGPAAEPSERRDLFAAAALTGLLSRGTNGPHAAVVSMAYEIADLMIASE